MLLVFAFLKYFIFGDVRPAGRDRSQGSRRGQRRELGKRQSKGSIGRGRGAISIDGNTSDSDGSNSSNGSNSSGGSSDEGNGRDGRRGRTLSARKATDASSAASVLRPTRPLSTGTLLEKTYHHRARHRSESNTKDSDQCHNHNHQHQHQYQQHHKHNRKMHRNSHHAESLDWFSVLVAQSIAHFRTDAHADNVFLVRSLTEALNGGAKPGWMDEIRVTEISLGENFPLFSACRVVHGRRAGVEVPKSCDGGGNDKSERNGNEGRSSRKERGKRNKKKKRAQRMLHAHMDVELNDSITIGLETKLILNYPRPLAAALPVSLVVEVAQFRGTVSENTTLHIYVLPLFLAPLSIPDDIFSYPYPLPLHRRYHPYQILLL